MEIEKTKKKDDEIVLNTDLYNKLGTIILIVSILIGLYLFAETENDYLATSFIIGGLILKFVFTAVYSICYRLDLLISKK